MKIGIRDGCLKMAWEDVFAAAAELGYDGVELDIVKECEDGPLWTCEGRRMIEKAAQDAAITIPSFCAGLCWAFSPASDDPEVRSHSKRLLTQLCAFAAELEVRWILVPVTPGEEGVSHETGTDRWVAMMGELAPLAMNMGVVLCLENVGRGYGKSAAELIAMTDTVNSPGLQVYYDIGNAVAFGNDPVEEIKALGERTAVVHIKDREADLLGQGIVPIAECITALKAIGYDDWLILETPATDNPQAAGQANLAYLRGLL